MRFNYSADGGFPRYSHGDATINGYLYVFGGRLKIDPPEVDRLQDRLERSPAPVSPEMMRPLNLLRCRNDLWRLDLEQVFYPPPPGCPCAGHHGYLAIETSGCCA